MSFLRKVNEGMQVLDEPISTPEPVAKPIQKLATKSSSNSNSDTTVPFLAPEYVQDLRKSWDETQASFVDEPREAVAQADDLVASTIKKLTDSLNEARTNVGVHLRGDQINTEDLRVAMKKYRSLFQRLAGI